MSEISRRDVLKAIGLLPLVGTLGACDDATTTAADKSTAAAPGGQRVAAARYFTPHEAETVRVLVDYVIPRDERSGSATDARVPEFMDVFLAMPETAPELPAAIRGGLAWLDAECGRRYGAGTTFVRATDAQRRGVLDDIAWPRKARREMSHGVAFFNRFRDLTASGFFSSRIGYSDLQYQGNVALPEWPGCPEAALRRLGVGYELMASRKGAPPAA